jgi:hypothetical protein
LTVTPEAAETLALRLMALMMQDAGRAGAFLAAAGLTPGDLAARAADPDMLAGLVDFVLQDDAMVLEAAASLGLPPDRIVALRRALPGGLASDWG